MGKCTLIPAMKQLEHGGVLTTKDGNIVLNEELCSKFDFVIFNYSVYVMQLFPFLTLLQYIHSSYVYLLRN